MGYACTIGVAPVRSCLNSTREPHPATIALNSFKMSKQISLTLWSTIA